MDRRSFLTKFIAGETVLIAGCLDEGNSDDQAQTPINDDTGSGSRQQTKTEKSEPEITEDTAQSDTTGIRITGDWPHPKGGKLNQRWNQDASIPKETPEQLLSVSLAGESKRGQIPLVVDNRIYAPTVTTITAINATTGNREWRFTASTSEDDYIQYDPVFADGTLYVPTRTALVAIDAMTGEELWRSEGRSENPTVVDNTVFVAGPKLRAVDIKSGDNLWSYDVRSGDSTKIVAIAIKNGVIYGGAGWGSDVEALVAVDAQRGTEQWTWKSPEKVRVFNSISLSNNTIVGVDPNRGFGAISTQAGQELWTQQRDQYDLTNERIRLGPIISKNAYINIGQNTHKVSIETGDTQWKYNTGKDTVAFGASESLVITDGKTVYNLNQSDGSPNWTYETNEGFQSAVPVGEYIITLTKNSTIQVLGKS